MEDCKKSTGCPLSQARGTNSRPTKTEVKPTITNRRLSLSKLNCIMTVKWKARSKLSQHHLLKLKKWLTSAWRQTSSKSLRIFSRIWLSRPDSSLTRNKSSTSSLQMTRPKSYHSSFATKKSTRFWYMMPKKHTWFKAMTSLEPT